MYSYIIRTISAFCIVLLCVLYVMYVAPMFPYVILFLFFHSTVYQAIIVSGIKDPLLKPAAASNDAVRYSRIQPSETWPMMRALRG